MIDGGGEARPGAVLVALAGGPRAGTDRVVIYDASRKNRIVDGFDALEDTGLRGSVNIATGNVGFADTVDRIVAAQCRRCRP